MTWVTDTTYPMRGEPAEGELRETGHFHPCYMTKVTEPVKEHAGAKLDTV